jgi:hypothetical protein
MREIILGYGGLAVGIASLIIAWYQYRHKLKIEQFSKATLRGMAGDIAKIQQSAAWAKTNLKDALNTASQFPDSDLKPPLLKFISNGIGDATATDRLTVNLFNEVLIMQEAQFKTRIVTHPEREELELYKKEKTQLN